MLYIGIDLGTSAVKLLLLDEERRGAQHGIEGVPALLPAPGLERAGARGLAPGRHGRRARARRGLRRVAGRGHRRRRPDARPRRARRGRQGDTPRHTLERRAHQRGGGLPQQRDRQGEAQRAHREHSLRRLHRAQDTLDARERAREFRPHSEDNAAQGLYQLRPHRRPLLRLLRRERHAAPRRQEQALERRNARAVRNYRGPDAQALRELRVRRDAQARDRRRARPARGRQGLRGRGRQRRRGRRHRHRRRRRVQHLPRHQRHHLHLQRRLRRGPEQRAARLRARGRALPPDGLHALGRELQQVAHGGHLRHGGLQRRAGPDSARASSAKTTSTSCPTSWASAAR